MDNRRKAFFEKKDALPPLHVVCDHTLFRIKTYPAMMEALAKNIVIQGEHFEIKEKISIAQYIALEKALSKKAILDNIKVKVKLTDGSMKTFNTSELKLHPPRDTSNVMHFFNMIVAAPVLSGMQSMQSRTTRPEGVLRLRRESSEVRELNPINSRLNAITENAAAEESDDSEEFNHSNSWGKDA
jgi:hypothetical protein